jgi:hypothetical protein
VMMHANGRVNPAGLLRLLATILAMGFALPAMVAFPTGAGSVASAPQVTAVTVSAPRDATTRFGALGKYITRPDLAKPWGPRGARAYRLDIPLMSSMYRYRTSFDVPVDLRGMRAAGIKLVLTVRNAPWGADFPLPANGSADAAFKASLRAMIDQLQPHYIVYGNEVDIRAKYPGTAAQYRRLMRIGHRVASAKGVKDGGGAITGTMLAEATYADIRDREGREAARRFGKAAHIVFHQSPADKANAYIDACRAAGVDFFVWHSYFADPSVILTIKDYVERRFGGPSFINELGWRTGSARTGLRIIDALDRSDIPIVLLYGSGFGPNAPDQLWNMDGSLTSEGRIIAARLSGR